MPATNSRTSRSSTSPGPAVDLWELLRSRDKKEAWQLLSSRLRQLLNADRIHVLLATNDDNTLQLADSPYEPELDDSDLSRLEQHLDSQDVSVWSRSYEAALGTDEIESEIEAKLFDASATSTLWIVLRDGSRSILGAIVLARCIAPGEVKPSHFTEREKEAAASFASTAESALSCLRGMRVIRDVRQRIHKCTNRHDVLMATVEAARKMVRAKGAGILIPDAEVARGFIHGPQVGEGRPREGERIGTCGSFSRVIGSTTGVISDDGSLRAALSWGNGQPMGIIEVSPRVRQSFTPEDADNLAWLASYVASDWALVTKRVDEEDWQSALSRLSTPFEIGDAFLERIVSEFGIAGGIVYRADRRMEGLLGIAGVCPACAWDFCRSPFRADDNSAAMYALQHGSFSCCDPATDHRVNQDGRSQFGISGSLFAIPLGNPNAPFGCVVAWLDEKINDDEDRYEILAQISSLAQVASRPLSTALLAEGTEKSALLHKWVADILQRTLRQSELNTNLEAILECIQASGFTRVRLYEFHYGDTMIGKASVGMDEDVSAMFGGANPFSNEISKNAYTRQTYQDVARARTNSADFNPDDLLARIYTLRENTDGSVIADSSADVLNKPPGMPWAEVPIISSGKLYGVVAADKLADSPSANDVRWGEITDFDLDALDLFAQLAGRSYDMDAMRGMLVQRHLRVLDDYTDVSYPLNLVQRRILLYLTHGDEGLGFCRALLYRSTRNDSGSLEYRFCDSVGELQAAGFQKRCAAARGVKLHRTLEAADVEHTYDLNDVFADVVVESEEIQSIFSEGGSVARYSEQDVDAPSFILRLRDIGWDDVLLAQLRQGDEELGFLVVDRQWDPMGIIATDAEVLESASRHVGEILGRHQILVEHLQQIELLAKGLVHEFRSPLGRLCRIAGVVADREDGESVIEGIEHFEEPLNELCETIDAIDTVFFERKPERIELNELLKTDAATLDLLASRSIRFVPPSAIPNVPLVVVIPAIRLVLRNLIENAVEALCKNDPMCERTLALDAATLDGVVVITVRDSGPGVNARVLEKLNHDSPMFTSKKKLAGFGLFLSKWILRKHGASLRITSMPNEGLTATITLPLTQEASR